MSTLGWLFILFGFLTARQVLRGRVMQIPEDLGDAFIAFASADTDALGEVLARTGDSATATQAASTGTVGAPNDNPLTTVGNISVAAVNLGKKAKGYRWTATGPDYYDCSGLMWRAVQAVGYKGSRFSTATIRSRKEFKVITNPTVNDLVLWPAGSGGATGHMGVITGNDLFYSARSRSSGIGESKISTFRKTKPIYLRYVGPQTNVNPFK